MEPRKINRRQLFKCTSGVAAFAVASAAFCAKEYGMHPSERLFAELISPSITTAEEVAKSFAGAQTPLLMASYVLFYPGFLARTSTQGAVRELREAALRQKRGTHTTKQVNHRLDALPAAAAAHLLASSVDSDNRDTLCDTIIKSLADRNQETREIVLQNLISSADPGYDAYKNFAVNQGVLHAIEQIIEEAEDDERLLGAASQSATFLSNTVAILRSREEPERTLRPYTSLLARIRESRATHFWYLSRLIDLHAKTFAARMNDFHSLPPQPSEALMGWRGLQPMKAYLSHSSLMHARQTYMFLGVVQGRIPANEVMTLERAKQVIRSRIVFYRDFHLMDLVEIPDVLKVVPQQDRAFMQFLKQGELRQLIANPESAGIQTAHSNLSKADIELAGCVPFAQYCSDAWIQGMARTREEKRRDALWNCLTATGTIGTITYSTYKAAGFLADLALRVFCRNRRPPMHVREEAPREAYEAMYQVWREVDAGKYEGVDERQAELGDVELRNEQQSSDR